MATTAEHPTLSWEFMQEGQVFYRKQQVYSIHGKLPNLGDYIIAGCRNGGPLALMRDNTKLIAVGRATPIYAKSQIQVYSPAGEGLLLFSWDQAKIIKFGWTADERLVVLNEEGVYRLYDLQGEYTQFSLGNDANELGIVDAKIYDGGLVAMTGSLTFMEVKGWDGAQPLTLANPNLTSPPRSWNLISPDLSSSRYVEVLLSVNSTIFTLDSLSSTDQLLSRGPFSYISPSPNGKSLALLTEAGLLWVLSADFQRPLAEFDTKTAGAIDGESILQVEWSGNDAILVVWESMAVLVGPFGDTLKYYYGGNLFAITEKDGVKIVSTDSCDFIEKVPDSTLSVFRPGSTSPAAILFDAFEHFSRRSPKADEGIRSIRPTLGAAVDECIDAAGHEWEPYWQRKLLNVAKFGRAFLDLYDPRDFVTMGQTLKVLNAVRFHEIGIPITYSEYIYTSPSNLIARLTSRNLHLLAVRMSAHLSLSPDPVLKHWACAKIARSKTGATEADDDEVCRVIVKKFESVHAGSDTASSGLAPVRGGVSYAEIARRAWEVGRAGLATKLLDHEPRAGEQVPLLLSMKEDKLALVKAVDSGDTDLVYHVLLHLYKRLPLGTFFRLIEDGGAGLELANRLLQVYAREQNREMLRDFYYSDDRRVESAVLSLEEARHAKDVIAKINSVKAAQKFFSEDKDRKFEARMMDESVRLLTFQQQLEQESQGRISFTGMSVSETMKTCLLNGMSKKADQVKSDFSVPDKRFWYVKLYALTELRDFDGLEAFAKSKKSPIGYTPFVHHLVEKGFQKEAVVFVPRCEANKRVDLYVECGDWRAAGQECKERGDKARLEALRRTCPNSLITRELDQIAASMK